jgi:hypothetical protein
VTLKPYLHPSWSPDGTRLVFSQEVRNNSAGLRKYTFNIAVIDLAGRSINVTDIFRGAFNLNPLFSPDGDAVYFLSDADGFRNLYRYELRTEQLYRLTGYLTGISGITPWSPAISISHSTGKIAYNYYSGKAYRIVVADRHQFKAEPADPGHLDFGPATLPPMDHLVVSKVDTTLYNRVQNTVLPTDSVRSIEYKPKFKLDYFQTTPAGLSGAFTEQPGGSVSMILLRHGWHNSCIRAVAQRRRFMISAGKRLTSTRREKSNGEQRFAHSLPRRQHVHRQGFHNVRGCNDSVDVLRSIISACSRIM